MSSLSPFEIGGLTFIVVAAVWLALGSPGSMSVFKAILSPLDFVWRVSRTADGISKDMTSSLVARMLATLVAKAGAGVFIALGLALAAFLVLGVLGRFFPRFRLL